MRSNWGLSRCHLIPVPASYSVQRIWATRARAAECFDPFDQWNEPFGNGLRRQETAQRIVVAPAEGRHATFALVLCPN